MPHKRWHHRFRKNRSTVETEPIYVQHQSHNNTQAGSLGDVYTEAEKLLAQYDIHKRRFRSGRHKHHEDLLVRAVQELQGVAASGGAVEKLAYLAIQTPRAVAAQRAMDKRSGGIHSHDPHLYDLIDFNDAYVSTVLELPQEYLAGFPDQAKYLIDRFCKRVGSGCFSNDQWDAITRGLAREIAVYRAVLSFGYQVRMTSRREDAMGVDMRITDPVTGISFGIDVKSASSFHFRLIDLEREGRIDQQQREVAELSGVLPIVNGHGEEATPTTLLRIDDATYGRIEAFSVTDTEVLRSVLTDLFIE